MTAGIVNITFSYLIYNWFVFTTKGNYLSEWARCVAVYSGGIAISVLLFPVLVKVCAAITALTWSSHKILTRRGGILRPRYGGPVLLCPTIMSGRSVVQQLRSAYKLAAKRS